VISAWFSGTSVMCAVFIRIATPSSPGRVTINGTHILNAAPMIVRLDAARRLFAAITRCTWRKSVHQ
jgi:hypothetical protein